MESLERYRANIIFLLDTSGSMCGEKICKLNTLMAEAVNVAEEAAMKKEVQLFMRVVEFNSEAKWIVGDTRKGVGHIDWIPLSAEGRTDTAGAIDLATRSIMHREFLGARNYRPVVILITDGESNEPDKTIEAVANLKASLKVAADPTKDKIIRIAIGFNDANHDELVKFASIGNIYRDDGFDEKVPLVFNADTVDLEGVLGAAIALGTGYPDIFQSADRDGDWNGDW